MNSDIKNAVGELGHAFELFKDANDQRLLEVERKGSADPLTELKVNRLNTEIGRVQNVADMARNRVDMLETALNRSPVAEGKSNEYAEASQFQTERKSIYTGEFDIGHYRDYKQALSGYLRKNNAGSSVDEVKALSVGSDPDGG